MKDRRELSLKGRVRRFYFDNPTEELTHNMLRQKFGISKWTAVWVLRELVEEGLLESVHVIRLRPFAVVSVAGVETNIGEK